MIRLVSFMAKHVVYFMLAASVLCAVGVFNLAESEPLLVQVILAAWFVGHALAYHYVGRLDLALRLRPSELHRLRWHPAHRGLMSTIAGVHSGEQNHRYWFGCLVVSGALVLYGLVFTPVEWVSALAGGVLLCSGLFAVNSWLRKLQLPMVMRDLAECRRGIRYHSQTPESWFLWRKTLSQFTGIPLEHLLIPHQLSFSIHSPDTGWVSIDAACWPLPDKRHYLCGHRRTFHDGGGKVDWFVTFESDKFGQREVGRKPVGMSVLGKAFCRGRLTSLALYASGFTLGSEGGDNKPTLTSVAYYRRRGAA